MDVFSHDINYSANFVPRSNVLFRDCIMGYMWRQLMMEAKGMNDMNIGECKNDKKCK